MLNAKQTLTISSNQFITKFGGIIFWPKLLMVPCFYKRIFCFQRSLCYTYFFNLCFPTGGHDYKFEVKVNDFVLYVV